MADKPEEKQPTAREFVALRRRRNLAVFGAIMLLCLIFYAITILRMGGA